MRFFVCTLAAAVLVSGLALAQGDAIKKDLQKFEGTWEAVSGEAGGKPLPPEAVKGMTISFRGNKFVSRKKGEEIVQEGTIKLNLGRMPTEIDVTLSTGPEAGKTQRGIYKFEGDRLIICGTPPGSERPTAFKTEAGSGSVMIILRRVMAK